MTNQSVETTEEVTSFDERIEILGKELELSVRWQRPCILLVVYSSEYVRSDVEAALENYLFDLGQKAVRLHLKNQEPESVLAFLREFKDPDKGVFFVHGLDWGHEDEPGTYSTLNLQREFFIERQIRAVFWLTQNEIASLARFAPDFWAHRHRVIEFGESPKAERLLHEALESAWQGTGEYAGEFEDTDAKISLRESMLTELPSGDEATSVRGNLLLTLAILNWRKGDFERAGEQVQEALKIAARIQDKWFEAECYNALALIRTSTEQPDEAINAYKQAIRLAPDQIFAWNNLGNLCARIARNDEAMFAFRKAIECNPNDPIAWNGLANLHYKLGYMDDAIASYRRAIQSMPTLAQPWSGLGEVYAGMGRLDEAMKAYHKAIELNRQYIAPWLRLGMLYAKQERYREAAKAYQRALALDGRNGAVWNELGNLYIKSEALDDAVEAFSKAIEFDRGDGWAYSNLAHAYTLQGKYKQTVSLLVRSVELLQADKDKAVSWNRLGNVYRMLNDYANAVAAYQVADQLDHGSSASSRVQDEEVRDANLAMDAAQAPAQVEEPEAAPAPQEAPEAQPTAAIAAGDEPVSEKIEDAPAWLFSPEASQATMEPEAEAQADVRPVETNDAPDAASSHEQPAAEPPTNPSAPNTGSGGSKMDALKWNDEGNDCFKRGDLEGAVKAYNQAIRLDAEYGVAYGNLALTNLAQGHFSEAVLLYQRSIELVHTDADKAVCWNGLGNAYRCQKDYTNAMSAYQKAAALDPGTAGIRDRADDFESIQRPRDAQGWNDLGELLAKTGSTGEAISAFQRSIELDPEAIKTYNNLARTLISQGRYAETIPLYQKSIELLSDNKDKAAAWNRLGNVYRKLNDYDSAIKAYQKAVVLADEGVDLLTRARFSLLSNCYVNP